MRKIIFILVSVLVMISSCQKNSDEIVIGGAISLTGDNSMQGHRALNGILLAIDYVNENGGINGKKLKFVTEDTQTSAKGAINAYTKLVQMNDVDAIISTGDVEFQAINDITNKSKKVTVATVCSGMLENNRSPYLFRYCFNEKIQDAILMKYVKDSLLVNDLSLLYPNNLWGKEIEQYNELALKILNLSQKIADKERLKPKRIASCVLLPASSSSLIRALMMTLPSTAIPMERIIPAIPEMVRVRLNAFSKSRIAAV